MNTPLLAAENATNIHDVNKHAKRLMATIRSYTSAVRDPVRAVEHRAI